MTDETPPGSGRPPEGSDAEQTTPEATSPVEQPIEQPAEQDSVDPASATAESPVAPEGVEPPPPADSEEGPSAPPPGKSGSGKLVAIIASVLVVLLIAGVLGWFFVFRNDEHNITTPSTAGEIKRDSAQEKKFGQSLDQAEEQFKTQGKCKIGISYVKSAIYDQD